MDDPAGGRSSHFGDRSPWTTLAISMPVKTVLRHQRQVQRVLEHQKLLASSTFSNQTASTDAAG